MTLRTCFVLIILALLLVHPARADDWFDSVIHALGITKTPSLKGPVDEALSGELYVVSLGGSPPRQLTTGGGFRSPVFLPDGQALLALHDNDLVQIALQDGTTKPLCKLPHARKLLGVDRLDPDRLLLLEVETGVVQVGVLSLRSGKLTALPHDSKSKDHRQLLAHLKGDARDYGEIRLYTRSVSRRGLAGHEEWTEVYLQHGEVPPVNLSQCDGDNCCQPDLAPDGKWAAFVRVAR